MKLDLTFTGMDSFSFILQSLASFLSNFPSIIYINVKECRSIPARERRRQALCLMVFVSGEWAKHQVDSGGKTSLDNLCICTALRMSPTSASAVRFSAVRPGSELDASARGRHLRNKLNTRARDLQEFRFLIL